MNLCRLILCFPTLPVFWPQIFSAENLQLVLVPVAVNHEKLLSSVSSCPDQDLLENVVAASQVALWIYFTWEPRKQVAMVVSVLLLPWSRHRPLGSSGKYSWLSHYQDNYNSVISWFRFEILIFEILGFLFSGFTICLKNPTC